MSREPDPLMAECLEEATHIINAKWGGDTGEGEGDMAVTVAVHRLAVATIALALYQERCRHIVQAPPATGVLRVGEEWCKWEAPIVYEGQGDEKATFVGRADVGNS